MKCRNCQGELFRADILTRNYKQSYATNPSMAADFGVPAKLTCAKCGHTVSAWVTNEQLKILNERIGNLSQEVYKLKLEVKKKVPKEKPWWKFW